MAGEMAVEAVTILLHQSIIAEATEDSALDVVALVMAMLPPDPTMVVVLLLEFMIVDTTEAVSVGATIVALLAVATIVALLVWATTVAITAPLLVGSTIVAMEVLVATTAAMVDLKATIVAITVVMVDLVAKTVLLLLVDTTVSIDRLKMTKENHKLTEPMTLSKSSEIMVRTMASVSRS